MRRLLSILLLAVASHSLPAEQPLSLNSENPHYFSFRGQPSMLMTSAEHYGAVLNPEFDFEKYLDELERHGLNLTRVRPRQERRPPGCSGIRRVSVLSEPGKQYAIYFFGGPSEKPSLALPPGEYQADWVSPITGKVLKSEVVHAKQTPVELTSHVLERDIALRIKRIDSKGCDRRPAGHFRSDGGSG